MEKLTIKKFIYGAFMVCAGVVFTGLIFHKPITYTVMEHHVNAFNNQFETVTAQELEENREKPAIYDVEQVDSISDVNVLSAQIDLLKGSSEGFNLTGYVAVPSVGINLPIFNGFYNNHLFFGAGTGKPNQVLGKGNYVLASHYSDRADLLFTPLEHASINDSIYVTDKNHIYEYKIIDKLRVSEHRGDLMEDVEDETLITLITCSDIHGNARIVVRGEFQTAWSFDEAPDHAKQSFNVRSKTY